MNKRILIPLVALLFFVNIFAARLVADIIRPGIYHGYFFVDRWGQAVLNRGHSYAFVSEAMAERLRKYQGTPIKLNVTQILQPLNPGAGMITEAEEPVISTSALMGLKVKLDVKDTKVVQGRGIELTATCKNTSKEAISVWPGALQVCLVTNQPFANKDIGYKGPDGLAYWCYQHDYFDVTRNRHLTVACRSDRVPWSAEEMAKHGNNLTTKPERRKWNSDVLVFGPGAEFTDNLVVGKELLAREYEVFVLWHSDFPCPMSNRIAVDVVKQPQEKLTQRAPAAAEKPHLE